MKNTFILIIISLFYLQVSAMELATTIWPTQESSHEVFYSTPRTFDWINEENQTSILTKLLILQKSNHLNKDVSNGIAHKLFILYTKEEYENLKKICPLRLGNQKCDFTELVSMPYSHRKQLIALVHPSAASQLIYGTNNNMLLEQDYNTLIEILPDDMKDNLAIKIVPNNCFCTYLPITIGSLMFLTGIGCGIAGIVTSSGYLAMPSISLIIAGPTTVIGWQQALNKSRAINLQEYNKLLPDV